MAGVRRLKSGRWQGWYHDWEGTRVFFTLAKTSTKTKVLETAEALEGHHAQIRHGVLPPPDPKAAALARPIGDVIAEYLAWGAAAGGKGGRPWAPKHAQHRHAQLTWWCEHLHLQKLQECLGILPAVDRAMYTLTAQGMSPQTRRHYRAALEAFCAWCWRCAYLPDNPLERATPLHVHAQARRRALTHMEIQRLLTHCHPAHQLLYITALLTGLRAHELQQLSLEHLDVDGCGLHLDPAWTKNRREAWQPLPRDLLTALYTSGRNGTALAQYQHPRRRRTIPALPLLFVPSNTSRLLYTDLGRADIPIHTSKGKMDFHALRTTYVNLVFEQGATPPEAQALARHRTVDMTVGVYGRAHDARLATLVNQAAARILPQGPCAPAVHAMVAGNDATPSRGEIIDAGGEHTGLLASPPQRPLLHAVSTQTHAERSLETCAGETKGAPMGQPDAPGVPPCRAPGVHADADLQRVMAAWPMLTDTQRAAVLAIIE